MKLALTGATGMVGSAIVRAARDADDVELRALVRDRGGAARVQSGQGVRVVAGSLEALPPELFAHGPDAVLHFAVRTTGSRAELAATNVAGTQRLIEALPSSATCVLYGSSLSVYGQGPQRGEAEEALSLRPQTALARSRLAAERLLYAHGRAAGCRVFGLRPRFLLGRGDQQTLPALLRLTRSGRRLGPGTQAFSVIDVDDYARLILALARTQGAVEQLGLNVGYARPLTLDAIQDALVAAFGLPPTTRRLRLPAPLTRALAWVPGLRKQVVRYQLVGADHHVDVSALRARCGGAILDRDPHEALNAAIELLAREEAA